MDKFTDIPKTHRTKLVSGKFAVVENKEILAGFGTTALIVCGGHSAKQNGSLDDVKLALTSAGCEFSVFSEIEPNPLTSTCHKAGAYAHKLHADFIIGIGGGSSLDAAKAVAFYATNPSFGHSDIYKREGCREPLPVVLVGTTAGTGSEVTGVSVLTNAATGLKQSISGPDCYTRVAFCDYSYTSTMPKGVTISTCLDAFAHASESYLSAVATDESKAFAEKALRLLMPCLESHETQKGRPSDEIREKQYDGSIYAGLAIDITGCLFPHTLGYVLTESYGIPHGRACTAFTPVLFEIAKKEKPDEFAKLLEICGKTEEELLALIKKLTAVNIKISSDEAKDFAARWKKGNKNFNKTPGGFTLDNAVEALTGLAK